MSGFGGENASALRVAAENVRLLIARGAQVDARDEGGATPLHLAAQFGNEGVARALIAAGADINAHDNGLGLDGPGLTPLDYADVSDRASMVGLLRKAGA